MGGRQRERETQLFDSGEQLDDDFMTIVQQGWKYHKVHQALDLPEVVLVCFYRLKDPPTGPSPLAFQFSFHYCGYVVAYKSVCVICKKECSNRCSKCKRMFYCGSACQRQDWARHKLCCVAPTPLPPSDY